jgi:drug/metabolite transporter (DMT)-like permease
MRLAVKLVSGGDERMAKPFLWFAVVCLIWGSTFAAARIAVQDLPPLLLSGLRYLLVVTLLLVSSGRIADAFRRERVGRTILSGLLAITATYGLLFWGIRSTPSGIAGLVNMSIIPVGLFGMGIALGEERPSARLAVAIALGLVGLVALFWSRLGEGSGSVAGFAAIVAGTLCYCLGSVIARPLLRDLEPMVVTRAHALIGGTTLALLSVLFEDVPRSAWSALASPPVLASLVFLSVAGTIVAYTLYLRLMAVWGTTRAGLYAFVSPIVALVIGHHLFGEPIGWPEITGSVMLLAASALATSRNGDGRTVTPVDGD